MTVMFANGTIYKKRYEICNQDEIVNFKIIFYENHVSLTIPFNVSCNERCDHYRNIFQPELKINTYHNWILLSWEPMGHINYHYLISLSSNSTGIDSQLFITKSFDRFVLTNLNYSTWYQICIASIDYLWGTSLFKCVKTITKVQRNISVFAETHRVFLLLNDTNISHNLQGYIVRLKGVDLLFCRTILISMTNVSIKNIDHSCNHEQHEYSRYFQDLIINNLPAYSEFNIDIIPIDNNNQPDDNYQSVSVKTREGESGPVRDLKIRLRVKRWILIKFKLPAKINGKIIKYKIRIILLKINICSIEDSVISDKYYDNKLWQYIEMSNVTKCGDYVLEVSPVNGWHQNNGIGKSSNYSFVFPMNENINLLFTIKTLINNGINIYLNDSDILCRSISYVVELINRFNASDCVTMILTDTDCAALRDRILDRINCYNIEYPQQTNKFNVSFYGFNWPLLRYHYNIYRITDKIDRIISEDIQISNLNKMLTRKIQRKLDHTKFTKFCNN